MKTEYPFKPYQRAAIEFMSKRQWSILALDMRMGKSACALMDSWDAHQLLVICPVIAAVPWLREMEKWTPFRHSGNVQLLNSHSDKVNREVETHILPYSLLDTFLRKGMLPRPDYLIVDEMHYCKNPEALRTRMVMSIVPQVSRGAFLSGTPMPSRPAELWPVLHTLGVFKNQKEYERRYCAGWEAPWGWDARGACYLEELRENLDSIMFRRTKADLEGQWAEVQPPTVIEMDLPVDEREKEFRAEDIARNPSPLAFEAVSNILHDNALRKVPLAAQHIRDVLESENKVVVFAWHRDVLQQLALFLDDYFPVMIHGGHSATQRAAAVECFQNDPECRIMVANYQAAGEAITLDAASYIIFVECSWVPKDIHQPIARCSGHGQRDTVRTDILTIHRSIDAHVLHTVLKKQDNIDQVITETDMSNERARPQLTPLDQHIRELIETRALSRSTTVLGYLGELSLIPKKILHPTVQDEEQEETPAPKKKKATKKVTAKKVEPEPEPEPEEVEEEVVAEITFDDVRAKVAETLKAIGPEETKAILEEFDARKLSEVEEGQWANLIEVCNEKLDES